MRECVDGLEMMCRAATEAGLVVDGGYAERVRVPDVRYLAPLDGLDPVAAAPLACGGLTAFRAVHHALPVLGHGGRPKRVAVIGAGGLGQFAIRYLRLLSDADCRRRRHRRRQAHERARHRRRTRRSRLPTSSAQSMP